MEANQILQKIQRMQAEKKWNCSQLAVRSGVPQTTISSLFRRSNTPTIPTLTMICSAFDITLSQFFNEYDSIEGLSQSQKELLVCWDSLTEKQKSSILELMRNIIGSDAGGGNDYTA